MTTKPLTQRQEQTLQFIKSFITKNTYPPTVREIAEHLDLKSHSTAFSLLEQLVSKGYVKKGEGPRMIQVVDQGEADEEPQLKELELLLLKMWAEFGIEYIYKYKNRIKVFKREGLVSYELFCDLTYRMFIDVEDIANGDDLYPDDCKVNVLTLIKSRSVAYCTVRR